MRFSFGNEPRGNSRWLWVAPGELQTLKGGPGGNDLLFIFGAFLVHPGATHTQIGSDIGLGRLLGLFWSAVCFVCFVDSSSSRHGRSVQGAGTWAFVKARFQALDAALVSWPVFMLKLPCRVDKPLLSIRFVRQLQLVISVYLSRSTARWTNKQVKQKTVAKEFDLTPRPPRLGSFFLSKALDALSVGGHGQHLAESAQKVQAHDMVLCEPTKDDETQEERGTMMNHEETQEERGHPQVAQVGQVIASFPNKKPPIQLFTAVAVKRPTPFAPLHPTCRTSRWIQQTPVIQLSASANVEEREKLCFHSGQSMLGQ